MNREFEPYSETVVMAEVAEWRTPSVSRSWIRYAAIAITVLLLVAIARGSFTASSRTISEKALVRAYLQDIIVERRWDKWDEHFTPGVTYNGSSLSKLALKATADGLHLAFPDLEIAIEQQIVEDNSVVTRVTATGTHLGLFNTLRPTRRRVNFTIIAIDRIDDGRIAEMKHTVDMWGIVRQLTARDPNEVLLEPEAEVKP